jgi:hypothetical protein
MKILIIEEGGHVLVSGKPPEVGKRYNLEPADTATEAQNKAFHALLTCYWTSGAHSYTCDSYDRFRDEIKVKLGAGFEKIVYADIEDGKAVIITVHRKDEIPPRILADPDLRRMVLAKPLSWSLYTKKQRTETIDRLITEMHAAGVNSKAFHDILAGMQGETK